MAGRRGQRSELRDAPVNFFMFIMAGWQGSLRQLVHYSVILLTSIIAGRPARARYARDGLPHRPAVAGFVVGRNTRLFLPVSASPG